MLHLLYFTTASKRQPVKDFIEEEDIKAQAKIREVLEFFQQYGFHHLTSISAVCQGQLISGNFGQNIADSNIESFWQDLGMMLRCYFMQLSKKRRRHLCKPFKLPKNAFA